MTGASRADVRRRRDRRAETDPVRLDAAETGAVEADHARNPIQERIDAL